MSPSSTAPSECSAELQLSDDSLSAQKSASAEQAAVAKQVGWQSILSDACLIGVAFIWGINIPFMKNGLDQMDWYAFNAIRLVFSAIVLAALAWNEYRRGHRPAATLNKRNLLIYAIVVSGVYQFLFLLGISRTTSANTALIISTIPMWTALAARMFLLERLKLVAWFGLCVAFVGTLIVALQKPDLELGPQTLIGNLCIIGAALGWAAGTVISRPLLKSISPMQLSACSAVIALPFHVAIAAPALGEGVKQLANPAVLSIILYSGVFSTGLALPMWSFGVRHSGAARAAVFQNLVPVIAIAAAWLVRGEAAGWIQILGGALIIGGLVIMRASK